MNQFNQDPSVSSVGKVEKEQPQGLESGLEINRVRVKLLTESVEALKLKSDKVRETLSFTGLTPDQQQRVDVKKSEMAEKVEKIKNLLSKLTLGKVLAGAGVTALGLGAAALGAHDAMNSSPVAQLNTAVMLLTAVAVSGLGGLIYAEETKGRIAM